MPVWQVIYEELKQVNPNFEIISFAQDSGGEADAGPILDAANVTYTSVIDTNHHISALYNLVNVPSAVWVDEEGKIVRFFLTSSLYAHAHKRDDCQEANFTLFRFIRVVQECTKMVYSLYA